MGCKRVRFGGQKESFWKAKGVVLEIERKKPHTKNHKALPPAPPPQGGEGYDLRDYWRGNRLTVGGYSIPAIPTQSTENEG